MQKIKIYILIFPILLFATDSAEAFFTIDFAQSSSKIWSSITDVLKSKKKEFLEQFEKQANDRLISKEGGAFSIINQALDKTENAISIAGDPQGAVNSQLSSATGSVTGGAESAGNEAKDAAKSTAKEEAKKVADEAKKGLKEQLLALIGKKKNEFKEWNDDNREKRKAKKQAKQKNKQSKQKSSDGKEKKGFVTSAKEKYGFIAAEVAAKRELIAKVKAIAAQAASLKEELEAVETEREESVAANKALRDEQIAKLQENLKVYQEAAQQRVQQQEPSENESPAASENQPLAENFEAEKQTPDTQIVAGDEGSQVVAANQALKINAADKMLKVKKADIAVDEGSQIVAADKSLEMQMPVADGIDIFNVEEEEEEQDVIQALQAEIDQITLEQQLYETKAAADALVKAEKILSSQEQLKQLKEEGEKKLQEFITNSKAKAKEKKAKEEAKENFVAKDKALDSQTVKKVKKYRKRQRKESLTDTATLTAKSTVNNDDLSSEAEEITDFAAEDAESISTGMINANTNVKIKKANQLVNYIEVFIAHINANTSQSMALSETFRTSGEDKDFSKFNFDDYVLTEEKLKECMGEK